MREIVDFLSENKNFRVGTKFPVQQKDAVDVVFYHCKKHDYMYYPEPVTNEEGVRYRAGYYDETGKYYRELKLYHSFPEEGLVCKYCGYRLTEDELEGMETLKCPNCDASFELVTPADAVKKDKVRASEVRFTDRTEVAARRYIHMPDKRVAPTADVSRPRASYDPNYDADLGTDFDKKKDLNERDYERLSFGGVDAVGEKEEEKKYSEDDFAMGIAMFVVMAIFLLICFLVIRH